MKICYLSKGVNVHDQKVLRYLAQRHEVHLISYHGGALPYVEGLTVHQIRIPNGAIAFPIACALTPLLIRRIRPDVVQGNYLLTYGFYGALAHYHPLLQIPLGSDVFTAPNKNALYRRIVKYSLKQADLVNADCQALKQAMMNLGCPEEKIRVFLPFGIDPEKFNPGIDGSGIRRDLGWEENAIIVCTRNHEPVYGMEYLIRAIPKVVERHQEARFLLLGSGSQTKKLKRIVRRLDVDTYVKFLGDVPNEMVGKYLAASSVFVSASLSDGPCLSMLEAMACGVPCVVTNVEAILESVQDGVNGLVVPRKDPAALAQGICRLVGDEQLRQSYGQSGYQVAMRKALLDDGMRSLEDTYRLLVK